MHLRALIAPCLFPFLLLALPPETPQAAIHTYVCGLHFYNGQMQRQVTAHHYCAHVNEDLMQCVIYDSDRKDARLIGIEYVITARGFNALPAEEKKLWHSHAYEVKSGILSAPGLSAQAELALMKDFATTYGKTWHTWQVDRGDKVPLGPPQLMMAFTADGQVLNPPPAAAERRKRRAGLPTPAVAPEADAWRSGAPLQVELRPQPVEPDPPALAK